MTIPSSYNIVVVGMGHIGKFLLPAYEMLLAEKVSTNVFGVKATDRDIEEQRAMVPFQVSVNNTAELLREKNPDIVIMCPPPKQIPVVAKEILLPYFNEARQKGISLPDIYSFGPSPDPQFYYDLLGPDIRCVKFLPSMAQSYQDVPLHKIGGSFLCFVPNHNFPKDRFDRAVNVSDLFGQTFIVSHQDSLVGLTGKNTARTCFEISFAVSDAMVELGYNITTSQIGSAMRVFFREHLNIEGDGLCRSSIDEIPEIFRPFIKKLTIAWFEGIHRYIISTGCDPELGKKFHIANFETWLLTIQLATREELVVLTGKQATKGGVNEKAIETFMNYFDMQLRKSVNLCMDKTLPESFFDTAEGMAYTINLTVNRHSHRLAG